MEEREIVEAKQRDLRTTCYKAVIRFFLLVDLFRLRLQKYIFRGGSRTMGTLVILTFMVRLKKSNLSALKIRFIVVFLNVLD